MLPIMFKRSVALLLLALACPDLASAAGQPGCGVYPSEVINQLGGLSGCNMKKAGERPLWRGFPPSITQITRFVFTDGHSRYWIAVTVTENANGTAHMRVSGTKPRMNYRSVSTRRPTRRVRLSGDEVARINELGAQAGAWTFETGTWDGDDLYIHCQFLEMERATADMYRYSSVNISCNRPEKLMPLVNEVARLADLKADGLLFY